MLCNVKCAEKRQNIGVIASEGQKGRGVIERSDVRVRERAKKC